ncbi:hypothetical protein [Methanospirillum lacunae]|uniref:Integral membrane protein n=1 Tax=Methanospirillum lacunae TaxID=668570 RepID=A0A2V2N2C6_9EURY|nr:hypothetical protein [Methanospirillum lacunae]PWR74272.1 hypothetical protein DK846_03765 [Methanospirillum lacunae]
MNPLTLLISFSPWIVFGVLAGHSLVQLEICLVICLLLSVVLNWTDLKNKLIVPWATLLYFIIVCLLVIPLHVYEIIPFIGLASNVVLTLIAFGSIAVGKSFTIQYARKEVPQERWNDIHFIRINQVITGFWGLLFLLGTIKSIIELYIPDYFGVFGDAFLWISMIVGIVFTVKYPPYAKKKIAQKNSS